MKTFNIIGDIAGRYNELMLLLEKMPKDAEVILLGDLNDRGPDSNKVIQWAIDNNIRCVRSNHGDMLIDHYNSEHFASNSLWSGKYTHLNNGGHDTLVSYGGITNVPQEHINWLGNLPYYIQEDGLFLSHAPWHPQLTLEDACNTRDRGLTWNRRPPCRRDSYQIHGHNTYTTTYTDSEGDFGMCIDNSGNDELLGIHWPSKEIFKQPYLS